VVRYELDVDKVEMMIFRNNFDIRIPVDLSGFHSKLIVFVYIFTISDIVWISFLSSCGACVRLKRFDKSIDFFLDHP